MIRKPEFFQSLDRAMVAEFKAASGIHAQRLCFSRFTGEPRNLCLREQHKRFYSKWSWEYTIKYLPPEGYWNIHSQGWEGQQLQLPLSCISQLPLLRYQKGSKESLFYWVPLRNKQVNNISLLAIITINVIININNNGKTLEVCSYALCSGLSVCMYWLI